MAVRARARDNEAGATRPGAHGGLYKRSLLCCGCPPLTSRDQGAEARGGCRRRWAGRRGTRRPGSCRSRVTLETCSAAVTWRPAPLATWKIPWRFSAHDTAARRGARTQRPAATPTNRRSTSWRAARVGSGQPPGTGYRPATASPWRTTRVGSAQAQACCTRWPLLDHQVRHVVRRLRRNALACLATHGARRSAYLKPASCLRLSLHVVAAGEISVTDGEIIFGYKEAEQLPCHQVQLTG